MVLALLHHGATLLFIQEQRPSDTYQWFFPQQLKCLNNLTNQIVLIIIISHNSKNNINKQQDLSILYLSVSSISAHINDLRVFLNLFNHKFNIICISERTSAKHLYKQPI